MKVLVLGGTYFLGLSFLQQAYREGWELTVCNRGSRPLGVDRIREVVIDRKDADTIGRIPLENYDAVVDFCGYEAGDIERVLEHLGEKAGQYIFISTVDVLRRGGSEFLKEDAPFEERDFGGEAGAYIRGKQALERELWALSEKLHIPATIFRPAMIYGPGNYAPRENLFFDQILHAGQVLVPEDGEGRFQLVYVEDAAGAVRAAVGKDAAYGKTYHLCPPGDLTYEGFVSLLREAVGEEYRNFSPVPVSVSLITEKNIPLPFPLTKEESILCDGSAVTELGFSYGDPVADMKATWEYYLKKTGV